MQKSEDVVILMPQNFNNLTFAIGTYELLEDMQKTPCLPIFSEQAIEFLNLISSTLLKTGKNFSDVITFAFWCRKAALLKEKEQYMNEKLRLGKGISFHSTPSNVPVNFAFSFAAGLLAGNKNIVRLPAKDFEQVNIICQAINEALIKMPEMKPFVIMVRYQSTKEITDYFSSLCASRIIWGGDETIKHIRASELPPRANEITFADRYSFALFDSEAVLATQNIKKLVQDFYNDTFFSDQNACTSPRIIIWLGEKYKEAQDHFWTEVHKFVAEKYQLQAVQAVGKLAAFYALASNKEVNLVPQQDNLIMRIQLSTLDNDLMEYKYNSGFFFEYRAQDISEIYPLCANKCQTITYYGITQEKIQKFIQEYRPEGIDRVVPCGKSMEFSLIWDGYDLIRELSRRIEVQ